MSYTPHSCEPAVDPAEKLGVAAGYLANQVTTKKADVILSTLGPKAARLARVLGPTARTMVHGVALAAVHRLSGKGDREGTRVEDKQ